ncbi:hypothetical protein GOODEAATRI_025428 [Goodea atripinnis]|uniref:Uncharacterized protein n=1 Tax=Goodea atripinnis TaxID=208336 RepID=A0ABV0PRI8_9TELE
MANWALLCKCHSCGQTSQCPYGNLASRAAFWKHRNVPPHGSYAPNRESTLGDKGEQVAVTPPSAQSEAPSGGKEGCLGAGGLSTGNAVPLSLYRGPTPSPNQVVAHTPSSHEPHLGLGLGVGTLGAAEG